MNRSEGKKRLRFDCVASSFLLLELAFSSLGSSCTGEAEFDFEVEVGVEVKVEVEVKLQVEVGADSKASTVLHLRISIEFSRVEFQAARFAATTSNNSASKFEEPKQS